MTIPDMWSFIGETDNLTVVGNALDTAGVPESRNPIDQPIDVYEGYARSGLNLRAITPGHVASQARHQHQYHNHQRHHYGRNR